MKAKGKKSTEEKGPHLYDFSLKKETKHTRGDVRPLKIEDMAAKLIRTHGLDKAKQIVEPLTISSFKDSQGNIVTVNESSNYWTLVFNILRKGVKNAAS